MINVDLRTALVRARDEFFEQGNGARLLDRSILRNPDLATLLRNRLYEAWMHGATTQEELMKEKPSQTHKIIRKTLQWCRIKDGSGNESYEAESPIECEHVPGFVLYRITKRLADDSVIWVDSSDPTAQLNYNAWNHGKESTFATLEAAKAAFQDHADAIRDRQ